MTLPTDRLNTTLRVIREVLGNPALRRVELAFFSFNAVESGAWIAILLYAYQATGAESVGLVALAQLVPAGLCAPLAATLADRYPRERVLLGGYTLLTVALGLTATAMLRGFSPMVTYVAAIGAATSLTLVRPAQGALLPSLARTPGELTAANAVSSIAEAGGLLLGPLVAAGILAFSSPGAVLVVLTAVTAGATLSVLRVRPVNQPAMRQAEAAAPLLRSRREVVMEGFRALEQDRDARLLVAVLSSRMLMIGITDVLFVLLAFDLFMTGESGAAILAAALGAGGLLGGATAFLLVGHERIAPVLASCAAACGAAFAIIGAPVSALAAPALVVVAGTGLTVMDVAGRTILQRTIDDKVLARVFGILEGLAMWALALGSVLVTAVVAFTGLQGSLWVFAAVLPALIALAWPALKELDQRAVVPTRALALLGRLRMFEALHPPVMEALARHASWVTVPAMTPIIREGEHGDRFYVLDSGAVTVSKDGRFLRRLAAPGDSFGEIALLRDIPRTATVVADEPTVLLVLDRPSFLSAVTGNPAAAVALSRVADARYEDRDP
jgi:MFS family permease